MAEAEAEAILEKRFFNPTPEQKYMLSPLSPSRRDAYVCLVVVRVCFYPVHLGERPVVSLIIS